MGRTERRAAGGGASIGGAARRSLPSSARPPALLRQARSLVDAELLSHMHAALERIQAQALQSFGAHRDGGGVHSDDDDGEAKQHS